MPTSSPPPIPASTCVVAVRPDWTDNRGLLGYYNPITREYQPTPFLRLLVAAADEYRQAQRARRPSLPFFAILDEMNLARVEHYFSDFLSCLESGEPIHLHDDPLVAAGASEDGDPVPLHITIPPNLFITGTVNVDETTYMFSPKVLDRAFVLEFNDVNLHGLGASDSDDADQDPSPLSLKRFAGALDVRGKPTPSDYGSFRELLGGALHRALLGLNARLQTEHRHFGYRVAIEIARFVGLARTQAGEGAPVLWDAFDVALVAKVLPKLHGTQQEVEEILERLLAFAVDVEATGDQRDSGADWDLADGQLVANGEGRAPPRLPRAAAKLWRMLRRVRQIGFVSFIE
ncbi:MAG: McrB family protein [Nannocystales bacterium]